MLNDAPTDVEIDLTVFDATDYDNVTFSASDTYVDTAIYRYNVTSEGSGQYKLWRAAIPANSDFNKQVFRGQAATVAAYHNQMLVNNVLFEHISAANAEEEKPGKERGPLWVKTYGAFGGLALTQGLDIDNDAYGVIAGIDFSEAEMSRGWGFMPAVSVSYNGGRQEYKGVKTIQNGGRGDLTGTFRKDRFTGSVLVYAGGYGNEMSVAGYEDSAGNWFAGVAVKGAYDLPVSEKIIIQPNLQASYNKFGKQNWDSGLGNLSMYSGELSGANLSPGVDVIYDVRSGENAYLGIKYVDSINNEAGGRAGNVGLPEVGIARGYMEYALGVSKAWVSGISAYVSGIAFGGGRTGGGFRAGGSFKF
jgi:hypothetical protein